MIDQQRAVRQEARRLKARRVQRLCNRFERVVPRTQVQAERLKQAVDPRMIVNASIVKTQLGPRKLIRRKVHQIVSDHRPLSPTKKGKRRYSMKALYKAIRMVEKDKDQLPIFVHFVQRAYENDRVLQALINKLLPDLKSIESVNVQKSPYKLIIDVGQPNLLPPAEDRTDYGG